MRKSLFSGAILSLAVLAMVAGGCGKQAGTAAPTTGGPAATTAKAPAAASPAAPTAKTAATKTASAGGMLQGKTIGVSLLNKQHVFYQELERGMRDEAAKQGAQLIVESAEFDPKLQDDQVDNFIVQKVDAMILCPADSASVSGAVKKANAAGIPVFTADIAAKGGKVVSHIASDNKDGGKLAADYLAKLLKDKGNVIIIDDPAVESVQQRTAGFNAEIAKYPGIKVIADQSAEGQRAKARDVMENMLMAHPDINGVFAINDDSALGALAACRAHKGAENLVIVGFDATPEAVGEIMAGSQLKADVAQHPYLMAKMAIDTIGEYFAGKKVPRFVPVPVEIYDKAALEKMKTEGKLKQVGGQWQISESSS